MAQQTSLIEDGFDRIQSVVRSVESEVQKVQKRFSEESEKFNKDASKRIKSFRKELKKYPAVKQAEALRKDLNKELETRSKQAGKTIENGIESLLGTFQIASQGEVEKLDKKLGRINRRLKALDKAINEATAGKTAASKTPGATNAVA